MLRPGGRAVLALRLRNPAAGRLDRSAYGFSAERTADLAAALSAAGLESTARRTADCDGEATLALLVTRGIRG